MTNELPTLKRVRQAAAVLTPAVIDLGPDQIQFCSYFDRIISVDSNKHLLLQPITSGLLPRHDPGPVSIHVCDPREPWTLICRSVRAVSDHSARVDLQDARIVRPDAQHRRIIHGHHQLALVSPHGVRESDAHVFPIVEIDSNSCVVDAMTPFEMGEHMNVVEIVGDQHVLRRCAATVCGIVAFCTADGSRRFRCTLELCEERSDSHQAAAEIVSDPTRIRRIVEFAAISSVCGLYEAPGWDSGSARFIEAGRDSLQFALFPAPQSRERPAFIQISFSLFAVDCVITLRVLELDGGFIRTALPLCLRRSRTFAREHELARTAHSHLQVRFRNPASGAYDEHQLTRLSVKRLTFQLEGSTHVMWRGLPLDDASLRSPNGVTHLGELVVENITPHGHWMRVELAVLNSSAQRELTRLHAALGQPDVSVHDGSDFRTILAMYKQAGLFAPHMRRNLDPILPQVKRIWHAMHRPDLELVQTFVHGPHETPDAALTVVRHWERAWLSQHFVSVGQQFSGGTGQLQLAVVDYIQRRADGQYYMFFVKADNKQMNAFLERFLATTGTPEATERCTVQLWRRLGNLPTWLAPRPEGYRVAGLRKTQELLVSRAAERVLGVNGAGGLSFVPGEFHLPNTEKEFARVDIARSRRCSVVSQGRVVEWAVIEELTSQGFNLTWMLNANWLVPVHAGQDARQDGLRMAIQHILEKPAQSPTGDRFINTVAEVDSRVLEEAGFEMLAEVYMYTLNRAGLNRYFHYTTDRYGEVDLRTRQRQVRRSSIPLRADATERNDPQRGDTRRVV